MSGSDDYTIEHTSSARTSFRRTILFLDEVHRFNKAQQVKRSIIRLISVFLIKYY